MKNYILLTELTGISFWPAYIVFLRVGAFIAFMPGIGEQTIPVRFKLLFSIVLSIPILPFIDSVPPPSLYNVFLLSFTEPVVGLLLGIGLRLFILAMQIAGSIAAQSTSLAQISAGAFSDPMPAIGQLLTMAAVTIFFVLDLHVHTFLLILSSYSLLKIGIFPDPNQVVTWGTNQIAHCFSLAFQLSAPFILLSLIYNITLGAINRAMPQLMVIFVGAPFITWSTLFIFMLISTSITKVWVNNISQFIIWPFDIIP
jgi:flagellar biosynthetic protein FliR